MCIHTHIPLTSKPFLLIFSANVVWSICSNAAISLSQLASTSTLSQCLNILIQQIPVFVGQSCLIISNTFDGSVLNSCTPRSYHFWATLSFIYLSNISTVGLSVPTYRNSSKRHKQWTHSCKPMYICMILYISANILTNFNYYITNRCIATQQKAKKPITLSEDILSTQIFI